MKLKRMIASVLALLLMVSLLPIGAMAAEDNDAGKTVDVIASGDTMNNNSGTVTTNNGNLNHNLSGGGVVTNNKDITINHTGGTVDTNASTGTITENWGTVNDNSGKIKTNEAQPTEGKAGVVEVNNNSIETNKGTVGKKDESGNAVAGTGNNGTIKTNNGTVITNNEGGTVVTNAEEGKIGTNNGTVGDSDEYDSAFETATKDCETFEEFAAAVAGMKLETGNFGTITDNKGEIYYNDKDGVIVTNNGYVGLNNGTVETNNDSVGLNNGTVETNNEGVGLNNGTVGTNDASVNLNTGTVETNNGEVGLNTGTVETNAIDGFVGNDSTANFDGPFGYNADSSKEKPDVLQGKVENNFGTVKDYTKCVKDEDEPTIYYGLSWGENTDHLNLIDGAVKEGTEKNLDEIARSVTRDGYRMTGYTAYSRKYGENQEITEGTNHYTMKAPTWLKILWEKIVAAVESNEPEAKPEKKMSIPTTLSADQVKVGAYVRQGNLLFRIIEVNDDSIRVVVVGKLSEQALADMLGFLKQHLSDAQIAKINGEPELLEQELVTYFFGGTSEHIAFYAARDLFA